MAVNRNGFTRRDFLELAAGGALTAAFSGCASVAERFDFSKDKCPNIIFILTDDLGWRDLGCYDHPALRTPNLDRLAEQGCRFTDFYVTAPVCAPSRAGCLTGRIQNRFNMQEVINPGLGDSAAPIYHHLPHQEPTYARQLKQAGYHTGHVGKWHLSCLGLAGEPSPAEYGFDYYITLEGSGTGYYKNPSNWTRNGAVIKGKLADWTADLYIDESIRFIESAGGKPFCLNLWTYAPHTPISTADEFKALYADRTEQEQVYFGAVTQLDHALGRLFKYLEDKGLSENTLIVFTSDNGPELMEGALIPDDRALPWGKIYTRGSTAFRDRKHDIYEGGIRVPAIIKWPGKVEPTTTSHVPVSTLDFFPTFCSIAGVTLPENIQLDGGDFRPAFEGKQIKRPHSLYWQFNFANGPISHNFWGLSSPHLAVRKNHWKLMCDLDFTNQELYNLDIDPTEQCNLIKCHLEIAQPMLEELKTIYQDVNKPYPEERYLNPNILELVKKKKG